MSANSRFFSPFAGEAKKSTMLTNDCMRFFFYQMEETEVIEDAFSEGFFNPVAIYLTIGDIIFIIKQEGDAARQIRIAKVSNLDSSGVVEVTNILQLQTSDVFDGNGTDLQTIIDGINTEISNINNNLTDINTAINSLQIAVNEINNQLPNFELKSNKETSLVGGNNDKYPTSQAVIDYMASIQQGFFVPKSLKLDAGVWSIVDYDSNEWQPNYILEYSDPMPDSGIIADAIALKVHSDPLSSAEDTIDLYVWNGTQWNLIINLAVSQGWMFNQYKSDTSYYWLNSEWREFQVQLDMTQYYTKIEVDAKFAQLDALYAKLVGDVMTGVLANQETAQLRNIEFTDTEPTIGEDGVIYGIYE